MAFEIINGKIIRCMTKAEAEERIVKMGEREVKMGEREAKVDAKIAKEQDAEAITSLQTRKDKIRDRIVLVGIRKTELQAQVDKL